MYFLGVKHDIYKHEPGVQVPGSDKKIPSFFLLRLLAMPTINASACRITRLRLFNL